jgi:hypothetical protein
VGTFSFLAVSCDVTWHASHTRRRVGWTGLGVACIAFIFLARRIHRRYVSTAICSSLAEACDLTRHRAVLQDSCLAPVVAPHHVPQLAVGPIDQGTPSCRAFIQTILINSLTLSCAAGAEGGWVPAGRTAPALLDQRTQLVSFPFPWRVRVHACVRVACGVCVCAVLTPAIRTGLTSRRPSRHPRRSPCWASSSPSPSPNSLPVPSPHLLP